MPWWPYPIAAILLMLGFIPVALGYKSTHSHTAPFIPRGETFMWDTSILILQSSSDMLTGLSYVAISVMLIYLVLTLGHSLPFKPAFIAFGAFIITCGATHLISVLTLWVPVFWLASLIKYTAAIASVGTALALPPLIPKVRKLADDVVESNIRAQDLFNLNETLEAQVAERTEKLQCSEKRARELTGKVVAAQQEERRRISRELHDGLTQEIIAVHQHLQAYYRRHKKTSSALVAAGVLSQDELTSLNDLMEKTVNLSGKSVKSARTVIDDLRPTILDDFGLPAALKQKVQDLRTNDEMNGATLSYQLSISPECMTDRLATEAETALYRIALEAIQNIQKHAGATEVRIELLIHADEEAAPNAVLIVADNGQGFDPKHIDEERRGPGEKIGLKSMRERVQLLGGDLFVCSTAGKGTTVRAEIPICQNTREDEDQDWGGLC